MNLRPGALFICARGKKKKEKGKGKRVSGCYNADEVTDFTC